MVVVTWSSRGGGEAFCRLNYSFSWKKLADTGRGLLCIPGAERTRHRTRYRLRIMTGVSRALQETLCGRALAVNDIE